MNKLSVVIICYNEEHIIQRCIAAAKKVSDDIVVVDSMSTDETPSICQTMGVHFAQQEWLGYGAQKNFGNTLAKNDWILSLDADEILSDELIKEINQLHLTHSTIYKIKRQNYYCGKKIRFGGLRRDYVRRIFSRNEIQWNTKAVHEDIETKAHQKEQTLRYKIDHYSIRSVEEHEKKVEKYTQLFAQQKYADKSKASWIKRYGSPCFKFVMDYIIRLGFLDGYYGWKIAQISSQETFLKYKLLSELYKSSKK